MDVQLQDYGVSTVIAIDDIFKDIDETKRLDEFPHDIIELLTDGQFDLFSNLTIKDYVVDTGDSEFINKLSEELYCSDYYSWIKSQENIDFKMIGADIERVREYISNIDEVDASRKHLVILDRELEAPIGPQKVNEIFKQVLQIVYDELDKKNLLLLIYTDKTIPDYLNSFEGAKSYLEELDFNEDDAEQMALHFNYVNKSDSLTNDFLDNILKSQKARYVQEYKDLFAQTYSKLTERLWQLNQNQELFYYDYLNEGQHADDIIYNIFLTKFSQVYSETFGDANKHSTLINPIRRSMQQHFSTVSDSQLKIYRELKEFEIKLTNNRGMLPIATSSDISFGDVIHVGDDYFMVMSQDCDITIRNDGTRKLDSFQLVKIEAKESVVSRSYLHKVYGNGTGGNKLLENEEFFNGLVKTGISQTILEEVKKNQCSREAIGNLIIKDSFKGNPKAISSISCFWLDSLLLKVNTSGEIHFTESNIKGSHELRTATSKYLEKKLDDLINTQLQGKTEEIINQILKFSLSNFKIEIKAIFEFDDQGTERLKGFKLKNIKRIGRLNRLEAMKILKDVLEDGGRIPDVQSILI
jgi:hypothetical protein